MHAVFLELEHRALCDVLDDPALLCSHRAGEGDLIDLVDELMKLAFLGDGQLAVAGLDLDAVGHGAAEDRLLGVGSDIREAAAAGDSLSKAGDIDVSDCIRLCKAEVADIQAAAVIEIELIGLIDIGLGIEGAAETEAAAGDSADRAALDCQGHLVRHAFFSRDCGDPLRNADSKVDRAVLFELERRTAADDLLRIQNLGLKGIDGLSLVACISGIVRAVQTLQLSGIICRNLYNIVDIDAGNLDKLGIQLAGLNDLLDLDNDNAAVVVNSHSLSGSIQRSNLLLHGHIALLVCVGAADEGDIHGKAGIEQLLFTLELDDLADIVFGLLIQAAAAVAGIRKGADADAGDGADAVCRAVTHHGSQGALRDIPAFDLVLGQKLAHVGDHVVVTADDLLDQPFVREVVDRRAVLVAGAGDVDDRQISGAASLRKAFLNSDLQSFRNVARNETGTYDCVIVLDKQCRFLCSNYFHF